MKIGEIYGFRMPSYLELMNRFYAYSYTSYYDFFTQSRLTTRSSFARSQCKSAIFLKTFPM